MNEQHRGGSARELLVASADYWFRAAKDESEPLAARLFFMENALNHTENALAEARVMLEGLIDSQERNGYVGVKMMEDARELLSRIKREA